MQRLLKRDAGIVERHIESTIGRYHPIDEGLDVIFDKNVGAHIGRLAAVGFYLALYGLSEMLPAPAECHPASLRSKRKRGGAADPRGSAGDRYPYHRSGGFRGGAMAVASSMTGQAPSLRGEADHKPDRSRAEKSTAMTRRKLRVARSTEAGADIARQVDNGA